MPRALSVCLVLALAACATSPEPSVSERLVGSWEQQVSILGQDKRSVLTFQPDGTFSEMGSTHGVKHIPLQGTWRVEGKSLELTYTAGFEGRGAAQKNERVIVLLTKTEFVSKDAKFGIEVRRTRKDSAP